MPSSTRTVGSWTQQSRGELLPFPESRPGPPSSLLCPVGTHTLARPLNSYWRRSRQVLGDLSLNCWPIPKPESTPQGQDPSLCRWVMAREVSLHLPVLASEALSFSQEPRVPALLNKRLISAMHTLLKRTHFPCVPTSHSGLQTSFL